MEDSLCFSRPSIAAKFVHINVVTTFLFFPVSARVTYKGDYQTEVPIVCKLTSGNGNETYSCTSREGHCCDNKCCFYYYELWWFWLIWGVIIIMTCCCFYHHRKRNLSYNRGQNLRHDGTYAGSCNYPGPPVDKDLLGYCKLPKYSEVIRIPPSGSPPPPYSERRVFRSIARLQPTSDGMPEIQLLQQNDLTSSLMSLVAQAFNINLRANSSVNVNSQSEDVMQSISEIDTHPMDSNNSLNGRKKAETKVLKCHPLNNKEDFVVKNEISETFDPCSPHLNGSANSPLIRSHAASPTSPVLSLGSEDVRLNMDEITTENSLPSLPSLQSSSGPPSVPHIIANMPVTNALENSSAM